MRLRDIIERQLADAKIEAGEAQELLRRSEGRVIDVRIMVERRQANDYWQNEVRRLYGELSKLEEV